MRTDLHSRFRHAPPGRALGAGALEYLIDVLGVGGVGDKGGLLQPVDVERLRQLLAVARRVRAHQPDVVGAALTGDGERDERVGGAGGVGVAGTVVTPVR